MGWKDGHSSYAVDGDEDTHLRRCAILDNYYVDYPVWMVDLGDRKTVRGVVIITWQGRGEGIRLFSDQIRQFHLTYIGSAFPIGYFSFLCYPI